MGSRKSRSKKRSNTSAGQQGKRPNPAFFIDRCSGKSIASVLRAAGLSVVHHDDIFTQTTLDVVWLAHCGSNDLFVISNDKNIRKNENEYRALLAAGVGAFFFTSGDWGAKEMDDALTKALPKIIGFTHNERRPFIARITKAGRLERWFNHKGVNLLSKSKK